MQLPKVYEPSEYEADIYALWEKSEAFIPKSRGSNKTYSIVIPPPNANGDLHLGHALTLGIEDIAVRYHRMKGEAALLLPGTDHAGFETQVVYEKELEKQGKSRFDFSRDELYQQIWEYVAGNRDKYEAQFRRLGASLDWSRLTFTLDDKIVKNAYATFRKMWEEGLIYRGERLVNFCTHHGTAFADIEVAYKEVPGHLWHIKYPLADGSGTITVATTRPETMLGDTAVAVHPEDERYKQHLGKTIKLPLTQREIPIIADNMVDREFGSGAVKITPAHDPNDYEVAKRHDLPFITVIDHEGKMTHETPAVYRGHPVDNARQLVIDDLRELGILEREEEYTHSVGHCYKCGTVIQPLLREQWFVDMQPLVGPAIKVLRGGEITFYPKSKQEQLIAYLKGLRDWNISRQIAWGIPIPAFQNVDEPDDWIYDERVGEETITVGKKTYRRDPDVFDTWFSSSSWPYATLDYPEGDDFKKFYPLSLMETGADILYPWVSRMIMFGLYNTGKVPFEAVYLHGLILDEKGAKMSKSKGNVVNPMEKIDQFGSDALRMGLITGQTPGNNQPYSDAKLVGARNFCNKLWNVARFVEDKIGDDYKLKGSAKAESLADHWMLYRLHQSTEVITAHLDNYRFSEASDAVYHLLWDDFADWYIEASKTHINKGVLAFGLETILKLAHPFAPFVSETIWQTLKWESGSLLMIASWPKPGSADGKKAAEFEILKDIVSEVRNIKGAMHLGDDISLYHANEKFMESHGELIASLSRLKAVKAVKDGDGLHLTSAPFRCWLDIDQDSARRFTEELKAKAEEIATSIERLEERLGNRGYIAKAPKHLVEESKNQLEDLKIQLNKIRDEYKRFGG